MVTLTKDSNRLWSDAQVVLNHGRIARLRSVLDRPAAPETRRAADARLRPRARPDGGSIWAIVALAATTIAGLVYLFYATLA